MKLPEDIIIAQDKLQRYLLLPRDESDKSQFLALAGYTGANWEVLAHDLRQFAAVHDVTVTETSPYGLKYEVRGTLQGPNGRTLHVVTVWITLTATHDTRFVTLYPDREAER